METMGTARTCAQCGKPIEGRNARAKYCSIKCNNDAGNEKRRQQIIASRQDRTCGQCGKPIAPEMTGRARFCSPGCRTQWFNAVHIKARTAERTAARSGRSCVECGR